MHKAGFVNIVGNPNVGKSTLMNCWWGNVFLLQRSSRRQLVIVSWES